MRASFADRTFERLQDNETLEETSFKAVTEAVPCSRSSKSTVSRKKNGDKTHD